MSIRPRVRFSGRLPKAGCDPDECEDRFALSATRFAVADGVSEASHSDVWAQILVDTFCGADAPAGDRSPSDAGPETLEWLIDSRAQWRRWADERAARELPWFAREKLLAGSFATFVGLAFEPGTSEHGVATWTAFACGDACIFLVRDNELALAFPVAAGDAFANSPPLLATVGNGGTGVRATSGTVCAGDRFYLATDALAQWFLADHGCGEKPWTALDGIRTPDALEILVSASRRSGALRNDDVTLIAIDTVPGE